MEIFVLSFFNHVWDSRNARVRLPENKFSQISTLATELVDQSLTVLKQWQKFICHLTSASQVCPSLAIKKNLQGPVFLALARLERFPLVPLQFRL